MTPETSSNARDEGAPAAYEAPKRTCCVLNHPLNAATNCMFCWALMTWVWTYGR